MITIADQFGIKEALKQLGIEAINEEHLPVNLILPTEKSLKVIHQQMEL